MGGQLHPYSSRKGPGLTNLLKKGTQQNNSLHILHIHHQQLTASYLDIIKPFTKPSLLIADPFFKVNHLLSTMLCLLFIALTQFNSGCKFIILILIYFDNLLIQ